MGSNFLLLFQIDFSLSNKYVANQCFTVMYNVLYNNTVVSKLNWFSKLRKPNSNN